MFYFSLEWALLIAEIMLWLPRRYSMDFRPSYIHTSYSRKHTPLQPAGRQATAPVCPKCSAYSTRNGDVNTDKPVSLVHSEPTYVYRNFRNIELYIPHYILYTEILSLLHKCKFFHLRTQMNVCCCCCCCCNYRHNHLFFVLPLYFLVFLMYFDF
jgi:hypothetical protein